MNPVDFHCRETPRPLNRSVAVGVLIASLATLPFSIDAADTPPARPVNQKADASLPRGAVHLEGHSLRDDSGPFLGLGVSYFQALRRAKFDKQRFENDLSFLAAQKFNYVRVLSMVGWYKAWEDLEIAPITFTNREGEEVEAWRDYWERFDEMIDTVYRNGMRSQITIFADAQLMPKKADRLAHMEKILQRIKGREHKVILIEVANEAWQNGFPGEQGIQDLREFTKFLTDRTSIPVAITSNHESGQKGVAALHKGTAADIATHHFSRDIRTEEGGWLPVRDTFWVGDLPDLPPFSSNEPIGPGSSVSAENDPIKLVMAAAFAWTAKLPMYVFHSSAGVFGHQPFEKMAGVRDFAQLRQILPPDLPGWVRNDGKEQSAPFTAYAIDHPNKWWTEINGAATGVLRNTGATKGAEFVTLPIGIRDGGVKLRARRPVEFRVYHPLTGAVLRQGSLRADEALMLEKGPGAYIIRGTVLTK